MDENSAVHNLALFLERCKIPNRARAAITAEVIDLGAANVEELTQDDWQSLSAWPLLKTCERRRILAMVPP